MDDVLNKARSRGVELSGKPTSRQLHYSHFPEHYVLDFCPMHESSRVSILALALNAVKENQ